GRGGSWNKKGVIIFAPTRLGAGLFRVPAAGGVATPITVLDEALTRSTHRYPWFLPDGRHFLYHRRSRDLEKGDDGIYVGDIDSRDDPKARRKVVTAGTNPAYAPPGYLLFVREGTLMAQPFDATTAQTTGYAAPVAERVDFSGPDAR